MAKRKSATTQTDLANERRSLTSELGVHTFFGAGSAPVHEQRGVPCSPRTPADNLPAALRPFFS